MIVFIRPIRLEDLSLLDEVYKEVFSGFPWYEDFACKSCKALYTKKEIREESRDRVFKLGTLENCLKCRQPLELASYYPEIVDQRKLIREAFYMGRFTGYIATLGEAPVGFTWGFSIPEARTESVDFPKVIPALESFGIFPNQAFYGAETGVIEKYQGKGLGKRLVTKRSLKAFIEGYKIFVNRTINSKMRKILSGLFSDSSPTLLFKDPETGSQWFSWDFENFDIDLAKQIAGDKNE